MSIEIKVIKNKKNEDFNFHVFENGEIVLVAKLKILSPECIRVTRADGKMSKEINYSMVKCGYEMGYDRCLFIAPPEQKVSRLAVLQRKTSKHWAYVLPLKEIVNNAN